jgi:hypothetical protein
MRKASFSLKQYNRQQQNTASASTLALLILAQIVILNGCHGKLHRMAPTARMLARFSWRGSDGNQCLATDTPQVLYYEHKNLALKATCTKRVFDIFSVEKHLKLTISWASIRVPTILKRTWDPAVIVSEASSPEVR